LLAVEDKIIKQWLCKLHQLQQSLIAVKTVSSENVMAHEMLETYLPIFSLVWVAYSNHGISSKYWNVGQKRMGHREFFVAGRDFRGGRKIAFGHVNPVAR